MLVARWWSSRSPGRRAGQSGSERLLHRATRPLARSSARGRWSARAARTAARSGFSFFCRPGVLRVRDSFALCFIGEAQSLQLELYLVKHVKYLNTDAGSVLYQVGAGQQRSSVGLWLWRRAAQLAAQRPLRAWCRVRTCAGRDSPRRKSTTSLSSSRACSEHLPQCPSRTHHPPRLHGRQEADLA